MWMPYTIVAKVREEPASKTRRLVLTPREERFMRK
jgi:hypothetical protein